METPEWIYPGAECEMRGGGQARIYAVDAGGLYTVHGAIAGHCDIWDIKTWTAQGNYRASSDTKIDLIGPWRPWKSQIPPAEYFADWVKWVAMDKGGLWRAFQEEPRSSERAVAWHVRMCSQIDMISSAVRMPTVPADQWRTTKIRIRED